MSFLAIITARGGSKRIPRKNIKNFCGKPIIAYSIEAALNSGIFDEVMVSTEDKEIANIAISYGAKVPFMRSEKNADDYSGTADVLLEVVEDYKKQGKSFDNICCIYPTAPFVTAKKLSEANQIFQKANVDALIPVIKFSYPPQRAFILEDNKLVYRWTENMFKRSQDLEDFYHDVGQFYFLKTEVLLREKTLVPNRTIPLIITEMEAQDIDDESDWKIAEMKYKLIFKYNTDKSGGGII